MSKNTELESKIKKKVFVLVSYLHLITGGVAKPRSKGRQKQRKPPQPGLERASHTGRQVSGSNEDLRVAKNVDFAAMPQTMGRKEDLFISIQSMETLLTE